MHGQDDVHWHLWSQDTLNLAKRENKLILISSGYFSCHWCHVMQAENYQNKALAKFLNQHFINVKIDRELTPDLDTFLIQFAQKAAGHAGWPQHVILTPEGYPFFAFVYQPQAQFETTMKKVVQFWQDAPQRIEAAAKKAVKDEQPISSANKPLGKHFASQFIQRLYQQVRAQMDDLSGGLKATAKFPNAPLLLALMSQPKLPDDIQDWLLLTLDQMQSQHLFDHINGGFYRYTVDPEWQIPHFEKMLYTQAQLAQLYFQASQRFKRPDYADTARASLDYVQRHLAQNGTALYLGSQSAIDKDDIEGGDYLFTPEQLKQRLNQAEYQQVKQEWLGVPMPYEAGYHPLPTAKYWSSIQQKLLTPPTQIPTDTKSLLGWNGLLLSAYADAIKTKPSKRYQTAGQALSKQLIQLMQQTNPPRALAENAQPLGRANIQDYAFILQGLKDWHSVIPNQNTANAIQHLNQQAKQRFLEKDGWHYSDAPLLPGQHGKWLMEDDAIPSPTALLDCAFPQHLAQSQTELLKYPLAYASYANTVKCLPISTQ